MSLNDRKQDLNELIAKDEQIRKSGDNRQRRKVKEQIETARAEAVARSKQTLGAEKQGNLEIAHTANDYLNAVYDENNQLEDCL